MSTGPNNLVIDPSRIAGDYACADTRADAKGGALGDLVSFIRHYFNSKIALPWVYPPPGSQMFDVQGLLATPAVGASGTVLTLIVPASMDCVIRLLSHNIIGPGFVQGSGALTWALTVDNAPYKGYGNLLVEFGSVGAIGPGPRPTYGILARASQTIRYNVSNVAYVAGGTNVVCTMIGWFYPSPRKKHNP